MRGAGKKGGWAVIMGDWSKEANWGRLQGVLNGIFLLIL
jgi:hypothetical protein